MQALRQAPGRKKLPAAVPATGTEEVKRAVSRRRPRVSGNCCTRTRRGSRDGLRKNLGNLYIRWNLRPGSALTPGGERGAHIIRIKAAEIDCHYCRNIFAALS